MKVFISWSGERSQLVADLLDEWIQCVIQAVDPWMSSKDIDRGSLWFSEIADQLANTSVGIICLTKENRNKPWILFESGALAKGLSSNRVCTFLIDLEPTDLENPLAQFNHTKPDRNGVWQLVKTINATLKDLALKEPILNKVFATYWPQFEEKFKSIIESTPDSAPIEKRQEYDVLNEVLSTVRVLDKRIRKIETVSDLAQTGVQNAHGQVIINTREHYERSAKGRISPLYLKIKSFVSQGFSWEEISQHLTTEGFDESQLIRAFSVYRGISG